MRKLIVILYILLAANNVFAQTNHVPNGSFEQYTGCPASISQVTLANNWFNYTGASPDFLHPCATLAIAQVPSNMFGYQPAKHGIAYGGIHINGPTGAYREFMRTTITPLTPGRLYKVSMWVSHSNNSLFACDGLGVHFFDNGALSYTTNGLPPVTAQISYASYGVITDTVNWIHLTKTFLADSAYDNMAIGYFNPSMQVISTPVAGGQGWAYYYIDSVEVKLDKGIFMGAITNTMLCRGDVIQVPFTVANGSVNFTPSNVFTLQLSDATGNFTIPTNLSTITGNAGATFTATLPMVLPAGNGYRLRITSSNIADTSEISVPLSIGNVVPVKPVAAANTPLCTSSDDLVLTATTTTPGVTWSWTGPMSFTSTLQNPAIATPGTLASGNYIVEASIYGCKSEKDTVAVMVYQMPAQIFATSNSPVCTGFNINLAATNTSPGVTWSWTGPGGYTAIVQNPVRGSITTSMSGDYIVAATENGCTVKDTVTVEVRPTPTVTASSNFNICEGQPINMLASSNEPLATFSWTGPGSFVASGSVVVRSNSTVAMSGSYIATAALNGCSSQYTLPVVVNPKPILPTVSSNSTACDTLRLFAASSPGASYQWSGPAGFSSTQQNPYIASATPGNNGTYTVFSTLGPCVSPGVSIQASVHPKPYLGAYASPNDTVCDGTVVTFVTVPMNGIVNPQFQWFKNGVAVPGQTSLTYAGTYTTGDKFYCRTYAQDLCNNNITLYSNEISMVVMPIINNLSASISSVPVIPQPGQSISFKCDVLSGGYTPQYQWRKNGVDVNGAISANWSVSNLAPYDEITCHVTSSDPCASPTQTLSNKLTINFPTGVADAQADNNISIYPNPNSGNFTIESKKHTIAEVEVLNSIGQQVYSLKADTMKLSISLPATLANGVYTLRMNTEAGATQQRITLQR